MAKGSLNVIEMHIEKILLGLAGLFVVAMFVMYFVMTPHTIDYNGRSLSPGELEDAIHQSAQGLQQAVRSSKPETPAPPQFASQLRAEFAQGVLSGEAVTLPAELTVAAEFGLPIPVLNEGEGEVDVAVVKPLRPDVPRPMTGRSMAFQTEATLEPRADTATPSGTPAETVWVSVGAWYPVEALRGEMTAAGYAPFRTRIYFTGVDAQRQVLRGDGTWSDWQDVPPSAAMPRVTMPIPAMDDESGYILNGEQLDEALDDVKAHQQQLAAPEFYSIDAGSLWDFPVPQADSIELAALVAQPEDRKRGPRPRQGRPPVGQPAAQPAARPGRDPRRPQQPRGRAAAEDRTAQVRAVRADIREAEQALAAQDLEQAIQLAEKALENPFCRGPMQRKAQNVRDAARKRLGVLSRTKSYGGTMLPHPELGDEKLAVWVHDDAVEAGRTYRYRLRARIWNRYVGRIKSVRDPQDALQAELVGEWSLPSDPVTVPPGTHFFLASGSTTNDGARVDVFKWVEGRWARESFEVRAGDVIGGLKRVRELDQEIDFNTGALVIDMRDDVPVQVRIPQGKRGEFTYRDQQSVVILYLDPADGQVKEMMYNRDDVLYKDLKEREI